MGQRYRRFSREQVQALWALWRDGQTAAAIADAIAMPETSVYGVVRRHGGIPPRARRRAPHALSGAEREEISRGLAAGCSRRALARQLGRAPSTISREIRRHGGDRQYRAARADAVRAYLVDNHDIPAERVQTIGYGPDRPIADNTSEEGRMLNRRTDIRVVLAPSAAPAP